MSFMVTDVEDIRTAGGATVMPDTLWHLSIRRNDGAELHVQPPKFDDKRLIAFVDSFLGV